MLEGFYGRPWSWAARRDCVAWMGTRGLDLFVLAPKDDALLRRRWREPLPPEYRAELRRLVDAGRKDSVEVAWTLSPGLDLRPGDPRDLDAAVAKYESVLALGVRRLVLAFDDTAPRPAQTDFADRVLARILAAHSDAELTVIPAEYWSDAAPDAYLAHAARKLDPRIRVGYAGPRILSRRIETDAALRFRKFIGHPLALGDNYPVQDRLVDQGRLFLGPLTGRDADLPRAIDAWLSNASPLPEASRIPLSTAADFARDPAHYDPRRSWDDALRAAGGKAYPALSRLARECSSSWISDLAPGGFSDALKAYAANHDKEKLRGLLREAARTPAELAALPSPELRRELAPWSDKLAAEAAAVLETLAPAKDGGRRLEALRLAAERNRAVVSDLAFERFLDGADPRTVRALIADEIERPTPGARAALLKALNRLIRAPALLATRESQSSRELNPWVEVLSLSASRTEVNLTASPRSPRGLEWNSPFSRLMQTGAARAHFIPLLVSQKLMDNFFDRLDAARGEDVSPRPLPPLLRVWLWARAGVRPDSVPVRLHRAIESYLQTRDDARLSALFRELRDAPNSIPRPVKNSLAEEGLPWLDKVGDYGAAGLQALALEKRPPGALPAAEAAEWRLTRERLRSGNGLELFLELKLDLDSFSDWLRLPSARRPPLPDRTLPANPADIL